jgi:hypothetical protein
VEGLCTLEGLLRWLIDVQYECQVSVSLEVHDTEIQFWETFTLEEFPESLEEESIYVALLQRLADRSQYGRLPEGTPKMQEDLKVECDRRGRYGRIRYIPDAVMGTAVEGSEEIFKV